MIVRCTDRKHLSKYAQQFVTLFFFVGCYVPLTADRMQTADTERVVYDQH